MTSIVLKTDNFDDEHGAYISDELTIVDAINGRMQYVIPNEFLNTLVEYMRKHILLKTVAIT